MFRRNENSFFFSIGAHFEAFLGLQNLFGDFVTDLLQNSGEREKPGEEQRRKIVIRTIYIRIYVYINEDESIDL